jgi:hypothetical protein
MDINWLESEWDSLQTAQLFGDVPVLYGDYNTITVEDDTVTFQVTTSPSGARSTSSVETCNSQNSTPE